MYRVFLIANCLISLLIGIAFYGIYDNTTIVTSYIYELFGYDHPILSADGQLLVVIRSYGLDLIWAYSLWFGINLCCFVFKYKILISSIVTIACSAAIEMLQLFGAFLGTADVLDVLFEAIGVCLAIIVYKLYFKLKGENNELRK